jgi:hypothetical protein
MENSSATNRSEWNSLLKQRLRELFGVEGLQVVWLLAGQDASGPENLCPLLSLGVHE